MQDAEEKRRISVTRKECPSPHSLGNKTARALWAMVWLLLFRPTPGILFGWRRFLLRLFGAHIGKGAEIMPSVRIWAPWNLEMGEHSCLGAYVDCYCVDKVSVGAHATVSQYSFLCTATHDISDPHMGLVTAPINIEGEAWVCGDVFVAPGITIGEGAVAGARAVVIRNVDQWTVVGGNPAKFIKIREVRTRDSE